MIFNSVTYLVFLALVAVGYWLLPRRPRLALILGASLVFYGFWRWQYTFVMLASMVIDYVASIRIAATDDERTRRRWLGLSLAGNLGLLVYFKYLGFLVGNAVGLAALVGINARPPDLGIVLPLGISFYTFQTVSYTIDVYRRVREPERDFVLYGCFVTFFPQLVAGPILRASEVIEQLHERPAFRWVDVSEGAKRVLLGLFLKTVLADNVAGVVDDAFAQPVDVLTALDVWTMAFLFGFQIYFDFSAYSHIALGSARMLGIVFPENFNFPYAATSPRDFWRRWHISLSSWIRDYLYLPLCGVSVANTSMGGLDTSVGDRRRNLALVATWAIMGLWHGAAWTFVIWGLYHAVMVLGHRLLTSRPDGAARSSGSALAALGSWALTLASMMLGWIPFRAAGVADTLTMFGRVLDPRGYVHLGVLRENVYLTAACCLVAVVLAHQVHARVLPWLRERPAARIPVESVAFAIVCGLVIVFLRPVHQFIYFQF